MTGGRSEDPGAMILELTDEQISLQDSLRSILNRRSGSDDPRQLWTRLATEVGLSGIGIAERDGGVDGTLYDQAAAAEVLGAVPVTTPFLSTTVLSATLLRELGDPAGDLPSLGHGTRTCTVASDAGAIRAEGSELTGTSRFVIEAPLADVVLVPTGSDLWAVDPTPALRIPEALLDPSRPLADLVLDAAPATRVATGDVATALERALRVTGVVLAAESVGGANACLDMAVTYAGQRRAFGRTIGSFQAVKHACASMYVAVEGARSAVRRAVDALAVGDTDADMLSDVAMARAAEAYLQCASSSIQVHGAIGVTWEHPAHRYLKRARSSFELLGPPEARYRAIADRLDPPELRHAP